MRAYDKMRNAGYSDGDWLIYNRLGPKARAVMYNAEKKINIVECLKAFHLSRKAPDPIWVDGDFLPQPLPSVYDSKEGDAEFATWLLVKLRKESGPPRSKQPTVDVKTITSKFRQVDLKPGLDVKAPKPDERELDI